MSVIENLFRYTHAKKLLKRARFNKVIAKINVCIFWDSVEDKHAIAKAEASKW